MPCVDGGVRRCWTTRYGLGVNRGYLVFLRGGIWCISYNDERDEKSHVLGVTALTPDKPFFAVLFCAVGHNIPRASPPHTMLSFVASASLSLNIGSSALTSARAAPSMVAAMETSFVYSPPAPLGTTSGEQYPNTVRRLLSSANTTLEACRTRQAHHQHVDFRA